jgi:hypothetical protein
MAKTDDTADAAPDHEADPYARRASEDLVEHAARLGRVARFGDARAIAAWEDAEAELKEASASPDPLTASSGEARATRIVEIVGDGMPDDPTDARWRDLVTMLGTPLAEIANVFPSARGVAVQTRNRDGLGPWLLIVGDDQPADANGRRGIMFLRRPDDYVGPFPVYGEAELPPQTGLTTGSLPGSSAPPGFVRAPFVPPQPDPASDALTSDRKV